MRARLVVFPVKGRNWCFSRRSIVGDEVSSQSAYVSQIPSTFKELYNKMFKDKNNKSFNSKTELLIDFASNKMNNGWIGLEKAPAGSVKNKIHGLGLRLLARVKPSEIFLKSITKEVTSVEIAYPASLNPRLVRRRLRHIALRGIIIHRNYFYGSATMIPLSSTLAVLPLPNFVLFWVLFRTYSHWRALQGSERLLQLVSDSSHPQKLPIHNVKQGGTNDSDEVQRSSKSLSPLWVLQPLEELDKFIHERGENDDLSDEEISDICRFFDLNTVDVLKYRDSL